jgi:hypothetical protein
MPRLLASDLFPELLEELRLCLLAYERPELIEQLVDLEIVDRCRCGESSCATFYTVPPPEGAWGPGHESLLLDSETGMLVLDVLDSKIVSVEVLNRDDIREKLPWSFAKSTST